MATFPKDVLEIINGSPALLSLLYDLGLMPEQVATERDVRLVTYLAAWYRVNADKVLRDARGL